MHAIKTRFRNPLQNRSKTDHMTPWEPARDRPDQRLLVGQQPGAFQPHPGRGADTRAPATLRSRSGDPGSSACSRLIAAVGRSAVRDRVGWSRNVSNVKNHDA